MKNSILPKPWTNAELSESANWNFRALKEAELPTALEYELQRELRRAQADDLESVPPPFGKLIAEWRGLSRSDFEPVYIPQRLRRGAPASETLVPVPNPEGLRPAPEGLLPSEKGLFSAESDAEYQWPAHTYRSPEFGPRLLVAIDPIQLQRRILFGNRAEILEDLAKVCHLPPPPPTKDGRQVPWPWLKTPVPDELKVRPLEILWVLGFLRLQSSGHSRDQAWEKVRGSRYPLYASSNINAQSFERQLNRSFGRVRKHLDGMREYLRVPRSWVALKLADKQV